MQSLYPAGPAGVPADLTQATSAYRRHAWLAMGGLALFVAFYLALSGWFLWTAWRLLSGLFQGDDFSLWTLIAGACAAFLALFMLKALVFVKHGHESDDLELRRADEPQLFEFLDRLADEAGAPRPHRVFLSARVNAAVFYDLSILNLIYPSRKNLEIGLGLVNVLTLGELKAVLAHEFGHFAQKSMAVGRWVYIAQQIANHVIARRDALDRFLAGLSRVDLRVAWIGWLLSLVVWSIRSLMETVFRIVIIGERALSREMELQADLVAVSLTGSDALIHALHKLGAADQAWDRALGFMGSELQQGRGVRDVFAVQLRIVTQMRTILGDPQYGEAPQVPDSDPQAHRVFRNELAQPPRMWATHPANSEREANAKRVYVASAIDARSAWALFADASAIRERMSTHLARNAKAAEPAAMDDSLRKLDEQYGRAFLDRSYRGAYLGRSVVRHAERVADLYGVKPAPDRVVDELAALYPQSLADDLEMWRRLAEEKGALEALRDGAMTAAGGVIRHGGRELDRHQLPHAIEELGEQVDAVSERVNNHDRRCRAAHVAAAASLGSGWPEYLQGLLSVLHYADHTEANLADAQGYFGNVFAVVTADGKVSSRELKRLIEAGRVLYAALAAVQEPAQEIALDRTLTRRLNAENWRAALEDLKLPPPTEENIQGWLQNVDSWVGSAQHSLSSLRLAALEQLLLAEAQVARFVRERMKPAQAPPPSKVPAQYSTLLPGKERPRQRKLGLWDRFQIADGLWPTLARLGVAAVIIGGVFVAAGAVSESTVVIYNGLGRAVDVGVGDAKTTVPPFQHAALTLPQESSYAVSARISGGGALETFEAETDSGFSRYVYNVAGAAPLVEWTASYGHASNVPDRPLGAPRWTTSNAEVLFEQPPEQIRGEAGGTRQVLTGLGDVMPQRALSMLATDAQREAVVALHARWDDSRSRYALYWITLARPLRDFDGIVAARLAEAPHDVLNLRVEQDLAKPDARADVCRRHAALAAANGSNADLQYIAARCISPEAAQDERFLELQSRWPRHGWLSMAAGYVHAGRARWPEALSLLGSAHRSVPPLAESLAVDIARINRLVAPDDRKAMGQLVASSEQLQYLRMLEPDAGAGAEWASAYHALARGRLEAAVSTARKAGSDEARILRFAAASDGAEAALIEQAFALPVDEGMDESTQWAMLGLAVRTGRDPAPYARMIAEANADDGRGAQTALAFVDSVRAGNNPAVAERALHDVMPYIRGQAYAAVTVALGASTPEQWRTSAKRLLFTAERPYLR